VRVIRSGDCKNSAKNSFVEEFTIDLFSQQSLAGRLEGGSPIPTLPLDIQKIQILHSISHGKVGAANGVLSVNGVEKRFAVFLEFTSVKGVLARKIDLYFSG